MKKSLLILNVIAMAAIVGFLHQRYQSNDNPATRAAAPIARPLKTNNQTATSFNKSQYSTTDPNSIWIIANKDHPLPSGFLPSALVVPKVALNLSASSEEMNVSQAMAPALEQLFIAAQNAGINLKLNSGYRSQVLQTQLYNSYVARDGVAAADTYSARPGTSEHQTGLAADLMASNGNCTLEICFAGTPEGMWLAAHANEYGFIIHYLKGKETITTYQFEPWHVRYVGNELAGQLYSSDLTMEEFFNY